MTEHKISIKDKQYTVAAPSLDKTMRITDHVSEILEQLPGIFEDMENYRVEYKIRNRQILTKEDVENPDNKEIVEGLGVSIEDFDNDDNVIVDPETGRVGIPFYKSPNETEVLAAVFPKIWKAARGNIVELCALIITTDGELEEHDKRGAVNGLLESRSHWLRHNANLEEIIEIISIGVVIFKQQLESASKSLGKVTSNLGTMLSDAQTTEDESAPNPDTEEKPAGEPS
jgi:hypothetical protein